MKTYTQAEVDELCRIHNDVTDRKLVLVLDRLHNGLIDLILKKYPSPIVVSDMKFVFDNLSLSIPSESKCDTSGKKSLSNFSTEGCDTPLRCYLPKCSNIVDVDCPSKFCKKHCDEFCITALFG